MARRNRRRTRSRSGRKGSQGSMPDLGLVLEPGMEAKVLPVRPMSAGHWQSQWDAWQSRQLQVQRLQQQRQMPQFKRQATSSLSSCSSTSSAYSHSQRPSVIIANSSTSSIVEQRLRMFGGDERDGASLCEPMLRVVMELFDGGLDYKDP